MKRLFVAVDLAISVVERLTLLQHELGRSVDETWGKKVRLRKVAAPNLHITLKYLGDVNRELVPMIHEVLRELCDPLFPFEVESKGVGVFPTATHPRILWAGLDEKGAEVLGLLQIALERDLFELGIEKETRSFRPHVTLARVKKEVAASFEDLIEPYAEISFGKSYIKDLVFYESHLDSSGPRYEVIHRFSLGSG